MLAAIERRLKKIEAVHAARNLEIYDLTDAELFAVMREAAPGEETETFIRWYETGEAPHNYRPTRLCAGATDYTDAQLSQIARGLAP